eukprot:gene10090-21025_t
MNFLRGLVSDMDDEIQPVKKENKIINDNMQRGFERLKQMFHASIERSDKLQMNMDSFQLSSKNEMEELKRRFEQSQSKSCRGESSPQGLTPYFKGQGIPDFEDRRSSRRRGKDISRSRPESDVKGHKEDHYRIKHKQQKEGKRDYPSDSSEVPPEEFGKLRLKYLTVDAVEDLCAHKRARKKNQGRTTHLLFSGLHNLSEQTILRMIHRRVTDVHVTTPAQYLKLPDGYKNSIKNFNRFNAMLGKYQLRFVTRWKFSSQETSTEFHLPLEKQGFTEGMVGIFVEKIPFDMGKRILHSISREKMRECHGFFEEFLILFNEQVTMVLEDTHRTARVSEVIYKSNPKEPVIKAVETPRRLHSVGFNDQRRSKENYVPDTFKSKFQASEQPKADDINKGNPRGILRTFKREQGASPGGCVCDKGDICKYKTGPEELLRETWDSYQIRQFKSPYARFKGKLYPEAVKVVHVASTYDEKNDQMSDGLVDEIISEDSNITNAMLGAVCPEACYTQRVHRSGQLNLITGEPISMSRVLFDSEALHGSYISKELTTVSELLAAAMVEIGFRINPTPFLTNAGDILKAKDPAGEFETLVNKAIGGTVFIDEAYLFKPSPRGQTANASNAVLDCLLKVAEEKRETTTFILAGYKDDIEDLLTYNEGFTSRFPKQFTFPFEDYDESHLRRILKNMVTTRGFLFETKKQCKVNLPKVLSRRIARGIGTKGFGNAREVRNRIDHCVGRQAARLGSLVLKKDAQSEKLSKDDTMIRTLTLSDTIGDRPDFTHSTTMKELN